MGRAGRSRIVDGSRTAVGCGHGELSLYLQVQACRMGAAHADGGREVTWRVPGEPLQWGGGAAVQRSRWLFNASLQTIVNRENLEKVLFFGCMIADKMINRGAGEGHVFSLRSDRNVLLFVALIICPGVDVNQNWTGVCGVRCLGQRGRQRTFMEIACWINCMV